MQKGENSLFPWLQFIFIFTFLSNLRMLGKQLTVRGLSQVQNFAQVQNSGSNNITCLLKLWGLNEITNEK